MNPNERNFLSSIVLAALVTTLSMPLAGQSVVDEGAEPNDLSGTPTVLQIGDLGQGVILSSIDRDAWKFTIPSARTAQISVMPSSPSILPPLLDPRITLFDANGSIVGGDDDSGDGAYPRLTIELPAGDYFAVVEGAVNFTFDHYEIEVVTYELGGPICTGQRSEIAEGPEPNGSPDLGGSPTFMPICGVGTGAVDSLGDSDWWSVTVARDTAVRIEVIENLNLPPGAGLQAGTTNLYDANRNLIETSTGSQGVPGSIGIIERNLAPGSYSIEVVGDRAEVGDYQIFVFGTTAGFLIDAVYAVSGVGCDGPSGPISLEPRTNERPVVGSVFTVDIRGQVPGVAYVGILGFVDFTPPIDLGILGAPGCYQYTDIAITESLPLLGASGRWLLPIPGIVGLAGVEFNQQVAALVPGHNALGVITSPVGEGTFGHKF